MIIVYCPVCHKRLFDIEWEGRTVISIKCPHCKQVVKIVETG